MDTKGFFLGLIAAVVLFLLWKREQGQTILGVTIPPAPGGDGSGAGAPSGAPGGCSGCSGGAGAPAATPPAYFGSPAIQSAMEALGLSGQISPGTPPLQGTLGEGSFYAASGPTPDNTFTNTPTTPAVVPKSPAPVTPGSASTPSTIVPVRAVATVPSYSYQGFQQRYNFLGIPRVYASRYLQ